MIKGYSVQEKRINCEIESLAQKERELSDILCETKLDLRTNQEHQEKYTELIKKEKFRIENVSKSEEYKNQDSAIKKLSSDIETNKMKLQIFERGESKIIKEKIDRTKLKIKEFEDELISLSDTKIKLANEYKEARDIQKSFDNLHGKNCVKFMAYLRRKSTGFDHCPVLIGNIFQPKQSTVIDPEYKIRSKDFANVVSKIKNTWLLKDNRDLTKFYSAAEYTGYNIQGPIITGCNYLTARLWQRKIFIFASYGKI